MLRFEVGDEFEYRTVNGHIARESDLLGAAQRVVQRMVIELRNYFGISANDAFRYILTLTLLDENSERNTAAWNSAYAVASSQLIRGIRQFSSIGVSAAEIRRRERVASTVLTNRWSTARNRIIQFLSQDTTIIIGTKSALSNNAVIGYEVRDRWTHEPIVMNPFTWYYSNAQPSLTFSSERARATYSPTLLLLHELAHLSYLGCMFPSHSNCNSHIVNPMEAETNIVWDVDDAIQAHIGIGLRLAYGGRAGARVLVDGLSTEYVNFPSEETLETGAPPPAHGR